MKKWRDLTSLGLLDDQCTPELPQRAWDELLPKPGQHSASSTIASTPHAPVSKPAPLARGSASGYSSPSKASIDPKVFSSRPTLRQLMDEYNGKGAKFSPSKMHSSAPRPIDFQFQSVDLIEIPFIPGKILRPSR